MSDNTYRIRFVERPLNERSLAPQAKAILASSSRREITISSVGIEMLSTIVGRGLSPALRRAVAEALVETLQGRIPDADTADDNIFTEVYGEIIGPLVTCLERGGSFDIIRLARASGADLLLVNRNSQEIILQECKGTFVGYNKVRESDGCLDVCQQIRNQRNKGKKQLNWPATDEVAGPRVHVQGNRGSSQPTFPRAENSVVVTAVPDGRLRRRTDAIDSPPHEPCDGPCTKTCLFAPEASLVSVLSSQRIDDSRPLDSSFKTFLDWYKTCERAIWGGADGAVGDLFAKTLSSWAQMEGATSREATTPFIVGLLDHAVQQGVYVDFSPVVDACKTVRQPDLVRAIHNLRDIQGERPTPRIDDVTPEELGATLHGAHNEDELARLIGNWQFQARRSRSEVAGTPVEAAIRREVDGTLSMRIVPRLFAAPSEAADDVRWGIAQILSGGRLPPDFVYESFSPETASWCRVREDEENKVSSKSFHLGQVLKGWPPLWLPFFDGRTLREMRDCCDWCRRFARLLEDNRWYFGRRHRVPYRWCSASIRPQTYPPAFVTDDARGFVTLPSLGR